MSSNSAPRPKRARPSPPTVVADAVLAAEQSCVAALAPLTFANPPVHTVYNPLDYAWDVHEAYVRKFATAPVPAVLVGMNPGPYGMAQTGVPFGQVAAVRDYMKLPTTLQVRQPVKVHPKRPIQGFDCPRSEVSGQRLWGWARDRYGDDFFRYYYVHNYCPLVFMSATGANVIPQKLPKTELAAVEDKCEHALRSVLAVLQPQIVVGVGEYAFKKVLALSDGARWKAEKILHPSPASPAANRGWASLADETMTRIIADYDLPVPLPLSSEAH